LCHEFKPYFFSVGYRETRRPIFSRRTGRKTLECHRRRNSLASNLLKLAPPFILGKRHWIVKFHAIVKRVNRRNFKNSIDGRDFLRFRRSATANIHVLSDSKWVANMSRNRWFWEIFSRMNWSPAVGSANQR